ncbi:SpoIIE family protein phosphatase [Kitasatospora aureofaciens]|uniref:PP2C family protein-serine/threonine phosphatase n=2 Tax=Kitasatospora aureofaciens TaxID=1894 RepID=UPI001C47AD1B|nr:GAF domain-containing SpoIIE family protein phosphatase [Kitasatospora aureofaciens]MBV6699133.1 SpoIIE family protein phosphatase [Kitasatospora aureofaciens]
MTRDQTGRLIGGIFGLVFVEVNAGTLPSVAGVPLRVLAIAAFVGLLVMLRRDRTPLPTRTAPRTNFGRRYRLVVAVEAVVGQSDHECDPGRCRSWGMQQAVDDKDAGQCVGSALGTTDGMLFEAHGDDVAGRATGRGLAVPLIAVGRVLGAVTFRRQAGSFSSEDVLLAREIAARTATAIDNALLYRRERLAALALQRHLLPARLPSATWFQPAYRYRPAEDDTLAGGDWYDALLLPGGRVGLGIGDVMGHGVGAAAAMGRYRSSVHALLAVGLPPGQLLTRLDGLFTGDAGELAATCACAVYDAGTGYCRLALAGHPPPLLIRPDGSADVLSPEPGPPLGMGLLHVYPDIKLPVPPGSLLVFYTDGMIEDRSAVLDLDQGIAILGRAVRDPGAPLDEVCDALMAARPAGSADDAALLVARLGRV